jgi:hypothetical protein
MITLLVYRCSFFFFVKGSDHSSKHLEKESLIDLMCHPHYNLLSSGPSNGSLSTNEEDMHESSFQVKRTRKYTQSLQVLVVSIIGNIVLLAIILQALYQKGPQNPIFPQALYCTSRIRLWSSDSLLTPKPLAPAQDAVKYQITRFHPGFSNDLSIYQQPPSPEVDQAWKNLYDGIIDKSS